jgi:hypothetical protein
VHIQLKYETILDLFVLIDIWVSTCRVMTGTISHFNILKKDAARESKMFKLYAKSINIFNIILLSAVLALTAAGCDVNPSNQTTVTGSPILREYDFNLTGFDQVIVTGPIQVEIVQADKASVSVKVNENIYQYLHVEQSVSVLYVSLETNSSYRNLDLKVSIGLRNLRALSISSAGECTLNGFTSVDLVEISLSGASRLNLTNLNAQNTSVYVTGASSITGTLNAEEGSKITLSGASKANLKGQTSYLLLNVSGASQASMDTYWANNAEILVTGVSTASVNIGGKLSVDLSGVSKLTYGGNPVLGSVRVDAVSTLNRR